LNRGRENLNGDLQMAVLTYFALLGGAFGLAMALMFGLRAVKLI
jgi:Cytochrome B6-F complex subunit VI (PetL)